MYTVQLNLFVFWL